MYIRCVVIQNTKKMKITSTGIEAIKGSLRLRNRLALEMDRHNASIEKWIRENKENGELTTAKALQIIKEETGLTESELLEEETIEKLAI